MKLANIRCLSGNALKILAALFMVIDHIGVLFFPYKISFRIIGRLALPIFAFMISEGARYTKNKTKYLLTISGLALICQLVYFFFANSLYMCILVTFSLSIVTIYSLNYFKKCLFDDKVSVIDKVFSGCLFILTVFAVAFLNRVLQIDYGFYGCMLPVFAALFDFRGVNLPEKYKYVDNIYVRILTLDIGMIMLSLQSGGIQFYSLLALPLLLCYSEQRGKANLKYFFYVFYPVHLVLLQAIDILLKLLKR